MCVSGRLSRPAQRGCITSLLQMPRLLAAELSSLLFTPDGAQSDSKNLVVASLIPEAADLMHRFHVRSPRSFSETAEAY